CYCALEQAELRMRHNALSIEFHLCSQTCAGRTSTVRAIKAKGTWRDFWQTDTAIDARRLLREQNLFAINDGDQHNTTAQFERRLKRIRNSLPEGWIDVLIWWLHS